MVFPLLAALTGEAASDATGDGFSAVFVEELLAQAFKKKVPPKDAEP
ncbi:MAG: hypothetical protein NHB32_24420 [Fischerella sp. CENA71]|nr:hypothetical protein [Fischerella sp. CENA71]